MFTVPQVITKEPRICANSHLGPETEQDQQLKSYPAHPITTSLLPTDRELLSLYSNFLKFFLIFKNVYLF